MKLFISDERFQLMEESDKLHMLLYDLLPFTNYSIQVSVYTRAGGSVRSSPIYIKTLQDRK